MEITFGHLKARWRRMTKQNEMNVTNVPNIITACCILHNMCEIHGDTFNEQRLEDINTEESDGTESVLLLPVEILEMPVQYAVH